MTCRSVGALIANRTLMIIVAAVGLAPATKNAIAADHTWSSPPAVPNGKIVLRPMMYVAVTYDHRIVDGREAVTFLKRIKECVEDPKRMLLEI